MKVVSCDGSVLEVRDAGEVIVRFETRRPAALKHNGCRVVTDDEARAIVRDVMSHPCYERTI